MHTSYDVQGITKDELKVLHQLVVAGRITAFITVKHGIQQYSLDVRHVDIVRTFAEGSSWIPAQ